MNLPPVFASNMKSLLQEEAATFFSALDEQPPVSVRYNPAKITPGSNHPWEAAWEGSVPWSEKACYLNHRPAFTFDPCLHAGCYYVQEASSMFVEQALKQALRGLTPSADPYLMLDLCAAPGGKSTLALSLLPENSLLVANEVVGSRARILQENLTKWGSPNVMITRNEAVDVGRLGPVFDVMLVDAPCSGEGLFRKDEAAVGEWSPEAVRQCALRQASILEDSLPALKPGGYLIYSTCTYNTEEDEAIVKRLVDVEGLEPVPLTVDEAWKVTGSLLKGADQLPVYRFLPHKTKGEGFFCCLLRKPLSEGENNQSPMGVQRETGKNTRQSKRSRQTVKSPFVITKAIKERLMQPEAYHWSVTEQGLIRAVPVNLLSVVTYLEASLNVLQVGITVGEIKGDQALPHPVLALSTRLNRAAFPVCELSLKQAVDFLRREALVLPEDCPRGWVLLTYQDQTLGWAKNMGSRANNGWPVEWRIRSANPFA